MHRVRSQPAYRLEIAPRDLLEPGLRDRREGLRERQQLRGDRRRQQVEFAARRNIRVAGEQVFGQGGTGPEHSTYENGPGPRHTGRRRQRRPRRGRQQPVGDLLLGASVVTQLCRLRACATVPIGGAVRSECAAEILAGIERPAQREAEIRAVDGRGARISDRRAQASDQRSIAASRRLQVGNARQRQEAARIGRQRRFVEHARLIT